MAGLRFSIVVGVSAIALALGGCGDPPKFFYPSPDGVVSLVVEPEYEGGPKAGLQNRVYFEGKGESASADAGPEEVPLGGFTGAWAPASIAWVDQTTVNVCPMAKSINVVREAPVVVTDAGAKRVYRVTTDCRRARRAAGAVGERPAG